MGITQLPSHWAGPSSGRRSAFVSGGAYALVFLLGLAEGVVGSFQYSRAAVGPVPLAALGFCIVILVTCGLAGWAMRSTAGALLPALGWFIASFGLAMPNPGGSVIIASTSAGEWYLYGGSVCALAGIGTTFLTTIRHSGGRP
ncbi:MAG TPA: hypothetical protein VGI74_13425 [Streptosporangiaceae bacterium]